MKSGWCLKEDCKYFNAGKDKEDCKYSEMTVLKKADDERARTQREMYRKLLLGDKNVTDEKLKERKEKGAVCEG